MRSVGNDFLKAYLIPFNGCSYGLPSDSESESFANGNSRRGKEKHLVKSKAERVSGKSTWIEAVMKECNTSSAGSSTYIEAMNIHTD